MAHIALTVAELHLLGLIARDPGFLLQDDRHPQLQRLLALGLAHRHRRGLAVTEQGRLALLGWGGLPIDSRTLH